MRFHDIRRTVAENRKSGRLLVEMNVLNADDYTDLLQGSIHAAIANRHGTLPQPVYDLLVKRLVRAAINDERGQMVNVTPVEPDKLPADVPQWAKAAAERGQPLVLITPKEDMSAKLAHIVDWLLADQSPLEAIRTQPEQGLLDNLYAQADRFFAEQNMRLTADEDEGGREVVMTFRKAPNETAIRHFEEQSLEPDPVRGPVVAFWCKLTSEGALNREGKLMQHCVGNYAEAVNHRGTSIYSLRDAANKPHVTVEASMQWDRAASEHRPAINQIKGKQNQPPLGKYRPFVKTFMNELGLTATNNGDNDAKTVGLITQGGRYGEYHEVARLLHEFPSGAKIMTLHEGLTPADKKGWGGAVSKTKVDTVYVLTDNSIGVELDFYFKPEQEITFEGATLIYTTIHRNAPRLFPSWVKDLLPFLNGGVEGNGSASLERLGIFRHNGRWGRLPEVGDRLVEVEGLVAYGIEGRVLIVEADSLAPVATLEHDRTFRRTRAFEFKVKPEAGNPRAGADLTRFMLAYARADEAGQLNATEEARMRTKLSQDSATRETMRRYGIIHVSAKQGWQAVGDVVAKDKKNSPIRESKFGSIHLYQQRWFFLSPDREFLGITPNPDYVYSRELGGSGPKVSFYDTHWNTDEQGEKLLRLLASVQITDTHPIILNGFAEEKVVNAGWVMRNGRLVHKSEVEGRTKLSGGASASLEVSGPGSAKLVVYQGDEEWVSIYADSEGVVSLSHRSEALDEIKARPALFAEALNAFHLAVNREDLLTLGLSFRNGHFVGLDPEADADITDYFNYRKGYVAPQGWKFRVQGKHGYIEMGARDDTIANIQIEGDELTVGMRKKVPEGLTRKDVVRAVAEALHWWHDRIEPVYHDGPTVYRVTHGGARG